MLRVHFEMDLLRKRFM